jgi:hypothetical protein
MLIMAIAGNQLQIDFHRHIPWLELETPEQRGDRGMFFDFVRLAVEEDPHRKHPLFRAPATAQDPSTASDHDEQPGYWPRISRLRAEPAKIRTIGAC